MRLSDNNSERDSLESPRLSGPPLNLDQEAALAKLGKKKQRASYTREDKEKFETTLPPHIYSNYRNMEIEYQRAMAAAYKKRGYF